MGNERRRGSVMRGSGVRVWEGRGMGYQDIGGVMRGK